jgi:hypothetical protein
MKFSEPGLKSQPDLIVDENNKIQHIILGCSTSIDVFTSKGKLDEKDITEPWAAFIKQLESRQYKRLTLNTWIIEDETHLSMFPAGLTHGLKTVLNK